MVDLNYADDIDDISDEARELIRNGVLPIKCYRSGYSMHLKVATRHEIDVCNELVNWYVQAKFGRKITSIGIGDYVRYGHLEYTF